MLIALYALGTILTAVVFGTLSPTAPGVARST